MGFKNSLNARGVSKVDPITNNAGVNNCPIPSFLQAITATIMNAGILKLMMDMQQEIDRLKNKIAKIREE